MKKHFILIAALALSMAGVLPCAAQDFQSGDLLYEIISEDPPEVTVAGHVDGQDAQGELNIPATVTFEGTEYTVAEISWYAFRGCHGLTGTLVIPNTVRVIGEYAFFECDGLSGSLVFPESVQEVRVGAFCQCTGFTGTLTFPESTTEVGNGRYNYNLSPSGAFQGCLGFDRLELPASLRFIGYCCFADCPNLKGQLSIPDGVTRIEIEAFSHDTGFTGELVLPESLESVEDRAFAGCTGIESLVLPSHFIFYTYWSSNEQRTAKSVFEGCNGLASVEIPEGWERTGPHIFENCTNLVSVHLPESLREINGVCFGNCASLSEINLPKGLTDIGGEAFSGCVSLTSIDLPDSLALLSNAFRGCTGLTGDMVIPDLVEKLWPFTFEGCMGLKHVILGSSINFVYEAAFNDTNLESLVIRAETPPTLDRMDMPYLPWDFPADLPIIVPCGALEAYQNAEGWNEFSNISEGNTFILKVLTDDEHKGSVTITKEPVCGDMDVVLEATSMDGKSFVCWKVNDETVSTDNPYRFELVQDTEITAVFSGMGVDENSPDAAIYPNPASKLVTITGKGIQQVEIHNLLGQRVASVEDHAAESLTVSLEGLPQGVYLVSVLLGDGKRHEKKLVVR